MKPKYFLSNDLLKPVRTAIKELKTILDDASRLNKDYLIKGTFVYSFGLFESTLKEYLKRYYLGFPEKNLDEFKGKKIDDLPYVFKSTFSYEIFEKIIDRNMRDISYDKIDIVLKRIETSFDKKFKIQYHKKELQEIKERRNLLMHNNLHVDKSYQVNTGSATLIGYNLNISLDYLINSVEIFIKILDQIEIFSSQVFADFTEENLIKSIWEYFFPDLLPFDQVSRVRGGGLDFCPSDKLEARKSSLSGSERTLLSLFLLNYNSDISQRYYTSGHLNSQAGTSKLAELIELFDRYPLLLQQN